MTSGDYEGDGAADLVVATKEPARLLLFANRNGSWQRQDLPLPLPERIDMVVTNDSNNDGRPDLAVTGSDGNLKVFHNQGDGSFSISPAASDLSGETIDPNEELVQETLAGFAGLVHTIASVLIPIDSVPETDPLAAQTTSVLVEVLKSDRSIPAGEIILRTTSRQIDFDPAVQAILDKEKPTAAD